jgi:hypothetical protein
LRVCSLAGPSDWTPIIADKKVSFTSVGRSPEEIRDELIEEKLAQLERESLLKKVDLLFRLCPPPPAFAPINNYEFDRERLKKIDDDRHGIIHKDGLGRPIAKIDGDLDFISGTANYLLALVNQRYGVQLNVIKLFKLPLSPENVAILQKKS